MRKNVVIFGPPGAGKGTQSTIIAEKFNLTHISTGEIARFSVSEGGELGNMVSSYIDKGELLPDDLIMDMLSNYIIRIKNKDDSDGLIFDGVPRTVKQADAMREVLAKLDLSLYTVILLKASDEVIIDRLLNRLVCKNCKKVFSKSNEGTPLICCGKSLSKRTDDGNEKLIRHRLSQYYQNLEPILEYYKSISINICEVNGEREELVVFDYIQNFLLSI